MGGEDLRPGAFTPSGEYWQESLDYWRFFCGWLFTIPLLALAWLWEDRDVRRLALASVLFLGAVLSLQVWENPHYAVPGTGLFFLLLTLAPQGPRGWRIGSFVARGLLPVRLAIPVANSLQGDGGPGCRWLPLTGYREPARERILSQLEATGGRRPVIVRYLPGHDVYEEQVYSAADIDAAPMVWARDMGLSETWICSDTSSAGAFGWSRGSPDVWRATLNTFRTYLALPAIGAVALEPAE